MTRATSSTRITKTSLALGSAVAIAGLVAAMPAEGASTNNPCSGMNMGPKSTGKPGKMNKVKSHHSSTTTSKMKSANCAACGGK
jgi:hypothetical protein